ncbi:MAG: TIGR00153 family protein [Deltaproteobacteria bacterium]|nr:MAG: TIGR00153 family protein [Deltaproteobacteria bacterium]
MRWLLSSLFFKSPFDNLQKHADKVKECTMLFKKAADLYMNGDFEEFERITDQVARLESEADAIKRNIRNHLPRGVLMHVDKFQFFLYIREQDKVMDEIEETLFWLSFKHERIPDVLKEDFKHLIDLVIKPVDKLPVLVSQARRYFRTHSNKDRDEVKSTVRDIRQWEREADFVERELKSKIFHHIKEALSVFYLIRLTELVGDIADHAENASDMMRAMIAK